MQLEHLLFLLFSISMLMAAGFVIFSRNPIHSAISLIVVFFFMAGLYVLLHAYFLATIQILVYAGAVMVLFLFVIMLLNVTEESQSRPNLLGVIGGLFAGPALLAEIAILLRRGSFGKIQFPSLLEGTTEEIGRLLFSTYLLPFEVASLILLVAMIGVILLSKKEKEPSS